MHSLVLMISHQFSKMSSKQNSTRRANVTPGRHVYRGIRDPIVADASATTMAPLTLAAGVEIGNSYILCPMGVQGMSWSTSSNPAVATAVPARLPFLFSTARNFQQYRVTRAVLVFVSSQGSTATGRISLSGSADAADNTTASAAMQFGMVNAKQVDLGSGASREARYQLPVDAVWKKVSSTTLTGLGGAIVPVNTVNDLSFSTALFNATGTTGTGNIGALYVEYDVEFKDPITNLGNA